jgi:hypothetical protein
MDAEETSGVIVFFGLGIGVGAWFVYMGIKNLAMKRLIEDIPTSKVR